MVAFYNEHDPFAAAWIRNLIVAGLIAPGLVDERDIRDIRPDDLRDFEQCHFFAGIGGWSLAARLAGWPDDRPLWTGSCPCQPFSAAGRGGGFADERHLWPSFFHLIGECRPPVVFGEQVASKDGLAWFDLVHADLEGAGYAVGAADLCAAGIGAPHIRQRLWFVAYAESARPHEQCRASGSEVFARRSDDAQQFTISSRDDRMANADPDGRIAASGTELHDAEYHTKPCGVLGDASTTRLERRDVGTVGHERSAAERAGAAGAMGDAPGGEQRGLREPPAGVRRKQSVGGLGPWGDVAWLACRDGKARPTQRRLQSVADGLWPSMVGSSTPYLSPLATSQRNRVGTLRGAGNAIVAPLAAEIMKAYLEFRP